jgi:hypothetical protein
MGLDIDNENILHFDHLAFLSLTIENYVNDPDLHALRLLSGITTPGLETLAKWPLLEEVHLAVSHPMELLYTSDFLDLREACEARCIGTSVT